MGLARRGAWLTAFVALLVTLVSAAAEPRFPALTGRVVDQAGLIGPAIRRQLEQDLAALEVQSTDQLVVVTLNSLQGYEIEEFGYRLGRHWGIGQAGTDNGVLLIVAPNERKVRIEVGRGLEPQLTDAMTKLIIENAILPEFRAGDFAGGIQAGVRDITSVLLGDAAEVEARAVSRGEDEIDILAVIVIAIWLTIFIIIVWSIIEGAGSGTKGKGKRGWVGNSRRTRRSRGGWGGSGGGWSGGSGGGFSGGGGGFGGGGSSGSW